MTARQLVQRLVYATLTLAALYVSACTANRFRLQANFDAIASGTTEASLIQKMGAPHEIDSVDSVNSLYATRPCAPPCVRRAWYYNPLQPKGFEAWSFELGANDRVVGSSHWLSP